MPYILTKKVTKDGAEFVIAALTAGQVEKFFGPEADKDKDPSLSALETICVSLNTSGGNPLPDGKSWTPEVLQEQTDTLAQLWLQEQIYDLTGLSVTKAGDAGE